MTRPVHGDMLFVQVSRITLASIDSVAEASAGQAITTEYLAAKAFFSFHSIPSSYSEAQDDCEKRGGNLASVANATENEILFNELGAGTWVGYPDVAVDQAWGLGRWHNRHLYKLGY